MPVNIGKLLLAGGAAFLGYRYFTSLQTPAAPAAAGGIMAANTPAAAATNPQTTRDLILKAAAEQNYTAASVLNADQWNWFYHRARGVDSPADPGLLGESRGPLMTFDEYWSWGTQHGLSGYRGVGYVSTMRPMSLGM